MGLLSVSHALMGCQVHPLVICLRQNGFILDLSSCSEEERNFVRLVVLCSKLIVILLQLLCDHLLTLLSYVVTGSFIKEPSHLDSLVKGHSVLENISLLRNTSRPDISEVSPCSDPSSINPTLPCLF